MSWRNDKIDVNNGKGGSRWTLREHIKIRTKKLRRRISKILSSEGL